MRRGLSLLIAGMFLVNSAVLTGSSTISYPSYVQNKFACKNIRNLRPVAAAQRNADSHNDEVALFDIDAIRVSLKEVQRKFSEIQKKLSSQRDDLDDEVIENLLFAYVYLNEIIKKKRDVTQNDMLELNTLVLVGKDFNKRLEYHKSISETKNKFYKRIDPIWKWYKRHEKSGTWKRATGMYVRILARPQLFVEGNHRTGALIASFILLRGDENPFVLNSENAVKYFNLSSDIKFRHGSSRFGKLKFWKPERKEMEKFLQQYADDRYKKAAPIDIIEPSLTALGEI